MKILIALLTLISVQAFACPDLSGKYVCVTKSSSEMMDVEQTLVNGSTRFVFINPKKPNDRRDYVDADGRTYRGGPDTPTQKKKTVRAYCEGQTLQVEHKGRFHMGGADSSPYQIDISLSMNGKNLIQLERSNVGGLPFTRKTICSPRN